MFDTGVRASELCGLMWSGLTIHNGYGTARVMGKGKKERVVPFGRETSRVLWRYVQETSRGPHCPVFQSDRGANGQGAHLTRWGLLQMFERLGEAAQISGVRCSPHTMRHTFAINYLRSGGDVFRLQNIMGHEDLKMTRRYCKFVEADVLSQHQQCSPADSLRATLRRGS